MDNILDKVRNNVTREYEMVYLLNKKDLYNIEWAYNLRNEQTYQNDSISVRLVAFYNFEQEYVAQPL